MDYKEKYEKALEKLQEALAPKDGCEISGLTRNCIEEIFPELKESEDEKMRKVILKGLIDCRDAPDMGWTNFGGASIDKCIDWIKKQDEKPQEKVDNSNKAEPKDYNSIDPYFAKPIDKAEPKFHEGDWVVDNEDGYFFEVTKVREHTYRIVSQEGEEFDIQLGVIEDNYHKFTIQDAKDGDVLYQDLMDGKTFIYNGVNPNMEILYSFIISNDGEDVLPYHIGKPNNGIGNIEENKNIIHPATKEQHEILFSKMRDAGYEWDAENRKPKKIESK